VNNTPRNQYRGRRPGEARSLWTRFPGGAVEVVDFSAHSDASAWQRVAGPAHTASRQKGQSFRERFLPRWHFQEGQPQKPPASRAEDDATPVLTLAQIKEMECANIERALAQCNGQVYGKNGAAALLGMKPTTLWSRLRSLRISTEK
jgi:transcriptional regulator with GAF, ATPase, and Fis domain